MTTTEDPDPRSSFDAAETELHEHLRADLANRRAWVAFREAHFAALATEQITPLPEP